METPDVFDEHSLPIDERLATGLYTLGLSVKQQERQQALELGLSPTQAQILSLLSVDGVKTPSDVATALGVSLPTVSDSVGTLVAKGLVRRQPSPRHHRATILTLTRAGRSLARRAELWPDFLKTAIGTLSDTQQQSLLPILVSLLRALQEGGQMPAQRMCLTCTSFRPFVHSAGHPHHCALVDAAMGSTQLRLVCDEHEMASSEVQTAHWQQFRKLAV